MNTLGTNAHQDGQRWQSVESLLRSLAEKGGLRGEEIDLQHTANLIKSLSAARIASLLEASPPKIRRFLWELVPLRREAQVLHHMEDAAREDLLRDMKTAELSVIVDDMEPDDVADLLQKMPDRITAEVLEMMSTQNRDRVRPVLQYAENSAGGLMTTDTVAVRPSLRTDAVLRYLRMQPERSSLVMDIYVVDRNDYFLGTLPLSRLLTAPLQSLVGDLMVKTDIETIPVSASASEVVSHFERSHLIVAPVIDDSKKFLGQITADDVARLIRAREARPFLGLVGLLGGEEDTFVPVLRAAPRRMVWLGINLFTAFIAAATIRLFEDTLDKVVALAILMPIVASMGGIAGSQTLMVVERGIARGHLRGGNTLWLLSREFRMSVLNALLWSLVVAVLAALWFQDAMIGVLIASALAINLITAALAGVWLPLLLRGLRMDPAVAGGVLLTTITDVVGFVAFLGLATLVYG